jgi:hypothetical protein
VGLINQTPTEPKGGLDESSPYIQEDLMSQAPTINGFDESNPYIYY